MTAWHKEHNKRMFLQTWAMLMSEQPELSLGQSAFNALCLIDPEESERVRRSKYNPFSDDSKLPEFFRQVWGIKFRLVDESA